MTASLVSYPVWDLTPPSLPPRSRLYPLEPLGLGTPQCEGMVSYLIRLAAAHAVSLATLVRWELAPHWTMTRRLLSARDVGTWAQVESHRCNGTGTYALSTVRVLEALTGRAKLHLLTLLPWGTAVADQDLLRRGHAQCRACARSR